MHLEKLYIKYLTKSITIDTLINEINQLITLQEIDDFLRNQLTPIIRLNSKTSEKFRAPKILETVIKKNFSDYEINKEFYAQSILKEQCNNILQQKITPLEFSKIISPLENIFNYPVWLGNLYDVFDRCDEDTEINDYMIGEITERIIDLERIENEHTT